MMFVFCMVVAVHAKHTVHVDEVFPNFGETVLISGPFTTDDIVMDVLDVGSLTINSSDGLDISTDAGFFIDGSSIQGDQSDSISFQTVNNDSTFTVVAATTIDGLANQINIAPADAFTANALGEFELLAGDALTIVAHAGDLSGESFEVSSAAGSIFFHSNDYFESSSPALTFKTAKDIEFLSITSLILDAQQSFEAKSSSSSINADIINLSAERNNLLVQGYRDISLESFIFDVEVKGDASFVSANGNLIFKDMNNLLFTASDDIEINSHDSVRFTVDGDSSFASSGNTFFLSDSESLYNFNEAASFLATQEFSSVSYKYDMESSSGNIILNSQSGIFDSTASDYTDFIGDSRILFTAASDISVTSLQGVDMRSERGRLYIGKFPATPSTSTPITFTAENNLFFDAGDLRITVDSINVSSTEGVRFETIDENRQSVQDWNLAGDFDFSITNGFVISSSYAEFIADSDMTLSANGDLVIEAVTSKGASIHISNEFDVNDSARYDLNYQGKTLTFSPSGDLLLSSVRMNFFSINNFEMEGDTTITFNTSEFDIRTDRNSIFNAGNDITLRTLLQSGDISFTGGAFYFDAREDFDITANGGDFTINSENIDFDSDNSASYGIGASGSEFIGSEFVIVNGDQSYDGYTNANFNGNLIIASPPGTPISVDSDSISLSGPSLFDGYNVDFDISNIIRFSPFTFEIESSFEEDLYWSSNSLIVNADDLEISNSQKDEILLDSYDRDNQFEFTSSESIFILPENGFEIEFLNDISVTAGQTTATRSSDLIINSDDVNIDSSSLISFESLTYQFRQLQSFTMFAPNNDIRMFFDDIDFFSNNEIFIRSDKEIVIDSASDDINLSGNREFTFTGGDIEFISFGSGNIDSNGYTMIHGSNDIEFSASSMIISFPDSAYFYGPDFTLNSQSGTTTISVADDIEFESAEANSFAIHQTNQANLSTFTSSYSRYQSNDEFIVNTGGNLLINSEDLLLQTSSQDAGQLYYLNNFFAVTTSEEIEFIVSDGAFDGSDISFFNVDTSDFTSLNGNIEINIDGSEFEKHFDSPIGILQRAETNNINFDAQIGSLTLDSILDLNIYSLDGGITHTTINGDIDINANDGLTGYAGNEINFDADNEFITTLNSYSIWKSSDVIDSTIQGELLFTTTGGNIDIIADRGEVSFEHEGTGVFEIESITSSIYGVGSAEFTWRFDGTVDSTAGESIELYGNSLSIFASTGISIDVIENVYFISSLNYDIEFDSDTVNAIADGPISFYGRRDIVWTATNGLSTFISNDEITFISEGDVNIQSDDNVNFISGESINISSDNSIYFDSANFITFGDNSGTISISGGGDTYDFGFYSDISDALNVSTIEDITITAGDLEIDTFDGSYQATNTFSIQSESSNVELHGYGNTVLGSIDNTITGSIVEYSIGKSLIFESLNQDISITSKTFIDIDTVGNTLYQSNSWTLTGDDFNYNSVGDSFFATSDLLFDISKTTSISADGDILMQSNSGFNVKTSGTNSPISFETRTIGSDILIDINNDFTSNSLGKTLLSGNGGVSILSGSDMNINSADDFTANAFGSFTIDSKDNNVLFFGDTTLGTGTRATLSSSGSTFYHSLVEIFINSGDELIFSPDVDLTFNAIRSELLAIEFHSEILFSIADDVDGEIDGDFTIYSTDTFIAADIIDFNFNGVWVEENIGAYFYSVDGDVNVSSSGDISLIGDNVYFSSFNSIGLGSTSSLASFNTVSGMSFTATETSSDFIFDASQNGEVLFTTTDTLSLLANGSDLSSGYISLSAFGSSSGTEYTWLNNLPYSVAIVSTQDDGDIYFNLENGKFVFDANDVIEVNPSENGSLLINSNSSDENGVGIYVQSGDLRIQSALNVILRAENIEFNELTHDLYFNVNSFESSAGITDFRPTIRTVHDQLYTTYGSNSNSNGIEIKSEVPANNIVVRSDNLNVASATDVNIIGAGNVYFESVFTTDIVSHSNIFVSGHSSSDNGGSVYFVSDYEINIDAESDIILNAANNLLLSAVGDIFIRGNTFNISGGSVEIKSEEELLVNADNRISMATDGDINFTSDFLSIFSNDDVEFETDYAGHGDIYIGNPDSQLMAGGQSDIVARIISFNSRIVDIPSTNAVTFPLTFSNCVQNPNGFWFTSTPPTVTLNYCDTLGNVHVVQLLGFI